MPGRPSPQPSSINNRFLIAFCLLSLDMEIVGRDVEDFEGSIRVGIYSVSCAVTAEAQKLSAWEARHQLTRSRCRRIFFDIS